MPKRASMVTHMRNRTEKRFTTNCKIKLNKLVDAGKLKIPKREAAL